MRRLTVYMLVAVLLSSAGAGTAALVMGGQQRRESDRRWCSLLSTLDDAYRGPPGPTTETGRKVAAEVHNLRVGFGCPVR